MRGLLLPAIAVWLLAGIAASAQSPLVAKPGSRAPRLVEATDIGRAPATERHKVVIGLDLRNRQDLEAFLIDVQNPSSPNYRRFLTQEEFNARYAPAVADEQALISYLQAEGFETVERYPNRLLVGAVGTVAAIERAFSVEIHHVLRAGRRHYAAMAEPSFPAELVPAIVGVIGLDDLDEMHPHVQVSEEPHAALGSTCCHFSPNDVATFYDNLRGDDGTGQTIVIAGAFAWQDSDNATFSSQWGLPPLAAGSGQVCTGSAGASGCQFSSTQSVEAALDSEYAHGAAPGARILNYMAASTAFSDFVPMYNRIVTDNPGQVVTTSWGFCEVLLSASVQQTDDNIFANANAVGQSWVVASGDNGSQDCEKTLSVNHPANSPHVMGVGGTTPACSGGMTPSSPGCAGYGSETGWSNSGGGISQVFARPAFQAGCGVPTGSQRLVPDVALEADPSPGNYVLLGGAWYAVGGTSYAAPQWAGFLAELSQKVGGTGLGNPGALFYGLCGTTAFHDVTSGSNGTYSAGPGYDLVTGLGTIEAKNFLALTAPSTTTTTVPTLVRCGDVNGDSVVNIADVLIVAQYDVGQRTCGQAPFSHPEVCDVNGDGACDIGDALLMAQCDVGLISCAFTCTPFVCR